MPSGSVTDLRDAGYLHLKVQGGYTTLQVDYNGGGDNYRDIITLKGVMGEAFWDHLVV